MMELTKADRMYALVFHLVVIGTVIAAFIFCWQQPKGKKEKHKRRKEV